MKKIRVFVHEVWVQAFDVVVEDEATREEERQAAIEAVSRGEGSLVEDNFEYSETLVPGEFYDTEWRTEIIYDFEDDEEE